MIAKVLIIDDDGSYRGMLTQQVQAMGHSATVARDLREGAEKSQSKQFDVILLDVNLPDGSGLESIPRFQQGVMPPEIIIITGFGDADGAELAIGSGVWDYLSKGASVDAIKLSLTRALQYRESRTKTMAPRALKLGNMVGSSPSFSVCLDLLAQAAGSNASVLVTGETGTGKELFASAIHENSARAQERFVVVDCAALPETLVESVLFGHEKGAFTGADRAQEGLIKQAGGGTLFLDEVGELPLSLQRSFLRALQEHRFRPVGARTEVSSDFRLIAATNRNLDEMVRDKTFRQDLLFRLRSLTAELPPLRNRMEDVRPLAFHFVKRFCTTQGLAPKGFSPEFMDALSSHTWPGNIRELANTIEGAVAAAGAEPILFAKHLPSHVRIHIARASFSATAPPIAENAEPSALPRELPPIHEYLAALCDRAEREYLLRLVTDANRDAETACRMSGLSRTRLYARLQKHRISLSGQ